MSAIFFSLIGFMARAVVVGTSVILADPIFQGFAISLMFGEITSNLISRLAVPVLYYMLKTRQVRLRKDPQEYTGDVKETGDNSVTLIFISSSDPAYGFVITIGAKII